MIIECPSCSTRFRLSNDRLRGLANPSFHCSRCGHRFKLDEQSLLHGRTQRNPQAQAPSRPFLNRPKLEGEQLALLPNLKQDFVSSKDPLPDAQPQVIQPELPFAVRWPDKSPDLAYEADLRSHFSGRPPLTTRPVPVSTHRTLAQALPAEDLAAVSSEEFITPCRVEVEAPTTAPFIETSQELLSRSVFSSTPQTSAEKALDLPVIWENAENSAAASRRRYSSWLQRLTPHSIRQRLLASPLLFITSVPAMFVLLFAALSMLLHTSPTLFKLVTSLPRSAQLLVPPAGLQLVQIEASPLTLDSGKKVLEIHGKIANNTPRGFRDLWLESKIYDQTNHVLARSLFSHHNGLTNAATLTTLSIEAINALQEKESLGSSVIKPGEQLPFRVIMTEPLDKASWFSSRIYSVYRTDT